MFAPHVVLLAIFAVAGVLHGLTGIGITLIATTALANIYPLSHALVLAVLPCLVINAIVFFDGGNLGYYLKKYWLLAVMSFLGSLVGTKLVFIISQNSLLIGLGLMIIGYVVMQWLGKNIVVKNTQPNLIISGLLAGVVGGATNAMSPILMMYLLSTTQSPTPTAMIATTTTIDPKTELMKASNLCYLVGKIAQFMVLWQVIVALPSIELVLIGSVTVVSVVSLYVGFYFRDKISQTLFKQLILFVLFGLGIKALLKGVGV